ncbi:putative ubiquitinyl hydrolase 1 [Arabidopsis thaliana]
MFCATLKTSLYKSYLNPRSNIKCPRNLLSLSRCLSVATYCVEKMGSKASDSAMLKTWRRNPPSSSLVRLSQLANDKYESPPFSSGGHNWRLVVYPKGNEADNGRGFVSMYVECLSSTTPPIDVFAYLTFFVFSEEEKRYLSIQDVEVKRFNSSKTVWGLSQVLPVETLKDLLPFHKFSWSIRDFALLEQNDCVSKTFHMGEKDWTLKLYPKGDSEADDKLSQHLHLADGETLSKGELIFVRVNLQVLDPRGSNHLKGWLKGWIMNSNKEMGLPQSMSFDKIEGAYLDREGTLEVEIECEIENSHKNHPFF